MTIFGGVVRWLRGRPVRAGNRYDPGDNTITSERIHGDGCSFVEKGCGSDLGIWWDSL